MNTYEITKEDYELIEAAKNTIVELYEDNRHHIGAALRTNSGKIVTAVHIEAYVGRITVCGEAIAVGRAVSEGEKGFHTIAAVRHPYSDEVDREIRVVSPCGMCRELISDYSPDCFVILEIDGELKKTKIQELIPLKYTRKTADMPLA
ncbi:MULTISPECIES: cytidine deaminase [unclassified Bacillus (in: firmicutes)]|uniref:cytidine deaminase n=1 Tax=unclassified Bacillus (in: firmicutes) TaxID=185979 RepID=UPI0008F34403|nr:MULTISPECIES: cytidine deaminase [unclassified Bacillus (in: firmicutes)]SFA71835.1 cytidine deaminase [Bacillus sp. UNCCL13]SFQ62141.1 cytidine deaminase [Bacillus sp. cl95]